MLNNMTKEITSEDIINAGRAQTGRSCGECSMCCKLLLIDEIDKPANQWCKHCRPGGGGCSIYNDRPPVCRGFACLWLVDSSLGEQWKPSRCKIVVHMKTVDGHTGINQGLMTCRFVVDPVVPNQWRQVPFYQAIKAAAFTGLTMANGVFFETVVEVGKRYWLILPDKDVEITNAESHITLPVGPDRWRVLTFDSEEKGSDLYEKMLLIKQKLDSMSPELRAAMRDELQLRIAHLKQRRGQPKKF